MMKGLMGRCLNHKMALNCVRVKARSTEDELACSEQVRGELEKQTEMLRQVFEDKEKEINDAKDQLRQAKEDAVREYRDSNALLAELGGSYVDGFDDCLHQVKTSLPDLYLSHVSIDALAQTLAQPVYFESTGELFADDALVDDPCGDGESAPIEGQIQSVKGDTR